MIDQGHRPKQRRTNNPWTIQTDQISNATKDKVPISLWFVEQPSFEKRP